MFNAKELDEETGLYYYGARYYDSRISWGLGVDPMAEKYYSWSPYAYCVNNPIKFIHPTGKSNGDFYRIGGDKIGTDGVNDGNQYIVLNKNEASQIAQTNRTEGITNKKNVNSAIGLPSNSVTKSF